MNREHEPAHNLMPIKLLLADVDGTLVTREKVLTPRALASVQALARAGIAFAITGNAQTNFAWDAGVGLALPVGPHWTADLGYRFIDLGELRSGTTLSIAGQTLLVTASQTGPAYIHAVTFGLRYSF